MIRSVAPVSFVRAGVALTTLGLLCAARPGGLPAQDSTRALDQGVRVGITYTPGTRPSIVLPPAPALDSLRAVVQRDLDYSDRFDVIPLPDDSPGDGLRLPTTSWTSGSRPPPPNYALFRSLGADYSLELLAGQAGAVARLHDVARQTVRQERKIPLTDPSAPGFRMAAHRLADDVVRWATGAPGIAASQIIYVANKRVYRVDSDGNGPSPLTGENEETLSPVWSPDGGRIAFTQFAAGHGSIVVLTLASGARLVVPSTSKDLNITPGFAPDGRTLAFARSNEDGTDLYAADVIDLCCVQRLTVGRFADNLSPTFSPDGRQMAFVSTRAGLPQIYVMATDGTDQELLAPFDYGVTGSSNAPEWSPDGASVVFHREVSGTPQLFVLEIASHRVRQLTSAGRNSDATWAPDGRHLAFVSDRSGRRQLWVIDTESGRIRQLTTSGAARLPSWSRRLVGAPAATNH